nr:lipoprotein LpqH [Mycobacterium sp. GA-1841]
MVAPAAAVTACAGPTDVPAGAMTARMVIDNQETHTTYPIDCTQRGWLWTIETLPQTPGFTAIVETGHAVAPKLVRIHDLAGFTGNAADEALVGAEMDGSTIRVSGTAHGAFADRPTKSAEVRFEMEAHC